MAIACVGCAERTQVPSTQRYRPLGQFAMLLLGLSARMTSITCLSQLLGGVQHGGVDHPNSAVGILSKMRDSRNRLGAQSLVRATRPLLSASSMRTRDLKKRLADLGISTDGYFEKEALVSLLEDYEATMKDMNADAHFAIPFVEVGGARGEPAAVHMELDVETGPPVRLLFDTGASTTLCTSAVGERISSPADSKITLRSSSHAPGFEFQCGVVGAEQYTFPPGLDGILGFDVMSKFSVVVLDWGSKVVRFYPSNSSDNQHNVKDAKAVLSIAQRQVSLGILPFVRSVFGEAPPCDAILDTGSPITMLTPELSAQAGISSSPGDSNFDVKATGVDGRPVLMQAMECPRTTLLGAREVDYEQARVYVGTCSMMELVGWAGKPAALIGLDLLRPKGAGGRTVFDWEKKEVRIL